MKRGEVWTVAEAGNYGGKSRPVVIVQDDRFDRTASVTVCAFTSDPTEAPLIRLLVDANEQNGLNMVSRLMVDKITTVPRRFGHDTAQPGDADLSQPRGITEPAQMRPQAAHPHPLL